MQPTNFLLIVVLLLAFPAGQAATLVPTQAHSTGKFEFTGTEIGQTHPFAKVHAQVVARNLTGTSMLIERIVPRGTEKVTIGFTPSQVNAGESFVAELDFSLTEEVGRVAHYFDVFVKGQPGPIDGFVVRGFADWLVSPDGLSIDFNTIKLAQPIEKVIPIDVRPGATLHLVGVEKPSAYFDVKIVRNGGALELHSRADAPWSSFDEKLLIRTDNPLQPIVAFRLKGQARGSVVPSSDPLDFGLLREGQAAEMMLVLNDVTGKPLNIGKVVAKSRMKVFTSVNDCVPKNESCKNVKVAYPPMNLLGTTGGTLEIELPSYKQNLVVRFGAIGIGKNTQIRSLEEDFKAAQEESKSISSVLQSSVTKTTEKAKAPATMSTPDGTGPLLKWQVTNEYDIYGYEIYRSVAETGPYSRVNDKILERLDGDPEAGSIYQWRDSSAESGNTYWYYINIVYNKGRKQQFTSPQKIVAK